VLDDKPNVATPTAELTHRALGSAADGRCRTADIWLRRHAQMANMKRSDATTLTSCVPQQCFTGGGGGGRCRSGCTNYENRGLIRRDAGGRPHRLGAAP